MFSKTFILSLLLPSIFAGKVSRSQCRDHDSYDYYTTHLDSSISPYDIAQHLGIEYDGEWSVLNDHHVFRSQKQDRDIIKDSKIELKVRRKQKRDLGPHLLDKVLFNQKEVRRRRLFKRGVISQRQDGTSSSILTKRDDQGLTAAAKAEKAALAKTLSIEDPNFDDQWHLFNTQYPGNDMNVAKAWLDGITGKNATVCIIDDGLDMDSEDLKPNYLPEGSWDFNDNNPVPKPKLFDDQHGTRCAGEVAAAKNHVCGVGVAYDSKISAVRILSRPIDDLSEAEAVEYRKDINHIYSCSWGPPDDGKTMDAPGVLIKKAMQNAVQKGRNGLGSIYVFAVGNGAHAGDNCNFDGYTNSIFSVSIGAVDKTKSHPYYSEACSAQLAVTYSSGAGDAIHTTDVGVNACTTQHGGTSAAGPLVSGVYALVLSVRPEMSWRDIQWLTVYSSQPFYKEEPEDQWQVTATGQKFSHQYGYGIVDAYEITKLAKTWKPVKKQSWYFSPWVHVRHALPEGDHGISSKIEVTKEMLHDVNFERIEHVTVTLNLDHQRRGDVSVELHSPTGIISYLATPRSKDESEDGFQDWTFMSVAHFGETGIGEWTLIVKDNLENGKTGTFIDWRIKFYGECIKSSKQKLLPMPTEGEDDDHDEDVPATTTGIVGTTSAPPHSAATQAPSAPASIISSIPTRPSISKPSDTNVPSDETLPSTEEPMEEHKNDPFLPSPFPTFGVSRRTQVWIYGALVIIALFCAGLGGFWFIQRRKKSRGTEYEFEMLDDQETDAMLETKGSRRKRAGELYDAFAGESDEELFSDASDDEPDNDVEAARFRDRLSEEDHIERG